MENLAQFTILILMHKIQKFKIFRTSVANSEFIFVQDEKESDL